MILGCGIDTIDIHRIHHSMTKFPDRFLKRVFAPLERRHGAKAAYYAKRFAAKEAALKAMGTGLRGLNWHDIMLASNEWGQPYIIPSPQCTTLIKTKFSVQKFQFHVSLSDSKDQALAMVILELTERS